MMSGTAVILLIIFFVMVARSKGPRLAGRGWSSPLPPEREQTPDELARERYARGEIAWPEYQEVLVNLLKDRYVRGELDLAEYEEHTSRVLDEAVLVPAKPSASLSAPATGDPAMSVEPERLPGDEHRPSGLEGGAHADPALEALRRRFLSGEITDEQYDEERERLTAA